MSASEQHLEILNNGRREAKIRRMVDPEDEDELVEILQLWLENEGWDRDMWHRFSITCLTHSRLIEVHAA
jgi:hypothetical protein